MARNSDGIFETVFASAGDKASPPFPFEEGYTPEYQIPISAGGSAPERTTENFLYNQLYALGVDVNTMGGALMWDATIQYQLSAYVTGSDGQQYIALTSNINIDPTTDGGSNWLRRPTLQDLTDLQAQYAEQADPDEGTRLIGHTTQTLFSKLNDLDAEDTNLQNQIDSITGGVRIFAGATGLAGGGFVNGTNISSIVRNNVGEYSVTFANPAPNGSYYISCLPDRSGANETNFSFKSLNRTPTTFGLIATEIVGPTTQRVDIDFTVIVVSP